MSEDSTTSETVLNVVAAPVTKKPSKPVKAESLEAAAVPISQTNGPTLTSLKRSTRSSGVSGEQKTSILLP